MSRIEPETLRDPESIYVAASLRAARQVEALLNSRGVDYAVQVESLGRTTLFGTLRYGAAFYVSSSQAEYCRFLLAEAGLAQGIVEDDPREAQ
jgi:hypothetical protein